MIIAFVVGLAATGIAVLIGVAAAYLGGLWDGSLSLLTDVLLVIPLFPLLIVIAGYAHGGGTLVLIAASSPLTSWSYTARQLRSQALSLRNRDFLEAARVRGERRLYIIVVEVIPTMTSLIVASFLTNALYAVLFASSLQFIGLGDPNTVSWGTMLYWAQNNAALQTGQPHVGASRRAPASPSSAPPSPCSTTPSTRSATRPCGRCETDTRGDSRAGATCLDGRLCLRSAACPSTTSWTAADVRAVDDVSLHRRPGRVPRHRRRVRLRQVHPAVRHRPAAGAAGRGHRRQRRRSRAATWSG